MKDWIYDEFNHVGIDYSKKDNVNDYDSQMESFREYEKEAKEFCNYSAGFGKVPPKKILIA